MIAVLANCCLRLCTAKKISHNQKTIILYNFYQNVCCTSKTTFSRWFIFIVFSNQICVFRYMKYYNNFSNTCLLFLVAWYRLLLFKFLLKFSFFIVNAFRCDHHTKDVCTRATGTPSLSASDTKHYKQKS